MIELRGGRLLPWSLLPALALLAGTAAAQDNNAACTLRGKDTVITGGVTVKACLDVDALNGQNIEIPANVTRIDNTGFSLCESSVNQGGLADIVYVMDQSGSMELQYIWISPDSRDTVLLNTLDGCGFSSNSTDVTGFGTVTVLNDAGTRQVRRINPNRSVATCRNFAGDPYAQRAIAFKQAIDFQALRAPNSFAGYTGFAQGLVSATAPRQLSTPAAVNALKNGISIVHNNNTNYQIGLEQAKKWLTNPVTSPNPSKAVIFLSDGRPTYPDSTSYLNVLSPTYAAAPGDMPPIYGIYLGRPSGDTARLADLSVRTGGRFYLIPPSRPDSLKTVVEQILNIILRQYQPNSAVINNTSLPNQIARAGATGFSRQVDGSWMMTLDKQVDLVRGGSNAVSVATELRETNSGDTLAKSANLTLRTTGPEERTNRNLPGTQFSVVCTPLPPDINVVKVAYIRDTDGDGAGDKVFFVFTRPLLALPASIDTVYWNRAAPGFQNKVAPVLSFLPGSNQTIVVADLTASPFPKGLTSIPEGEKPIGILPAGGVFQAQRPAINDSMGPILDSGLARPFDAKTAAPGGLNLDTLIIYVSEPMRTNRNWDNMLLWGKPVNGQCNDFANAKPVTPAREPIQGTDQKTFTIIIANGDGGPTPLVGDCIYLNTDGTQTDLPRNIPPEHGIPLRGRRPPREIELFRGYPPVVGFTADNPGFILVNNDPRKGDPLDYSKPNAAGKYEITWVPPVGFVENQPFNPLVPADPGMLPVNNLDAGSVAVALPRTISAVQVVSTGKYVANVSIFDTQGRFVKQFRQAFGYQGELTNGARIANKGLVSYLVWDLKDTKGQKAGQGVYIWKVVFSFENNKQEIQYTRTGVMRHPDWWLK